MPLSSDPPPLESQDDMLEASQSSLAEQVALSDLELHPFRVQHGCDAIQLHRGVRSWAAMTTKGGIIGMYETRDDAMRAAILSVMNENDIVRILTEQEREQKDPSMKPTTNSNTSSTTGTSKSSFMVLGTNDIRRKKISPAMDSAEKSPPKVTHNKQVLEKTELNQRQQPSSVPPLKRTLSKNEKVVGHYTSSHKAQTGTTAQNELSEGVCKQGDGVSKGRNFQYTAMGQIPVDTKESNSNKKRHREMPETNPKSLAMKHDFSTTAPSGSGPTGNRASLAIPVQKKITAGKSVKKTIELVDAETNELVIYFRKTIDACRTLGLTRNSVLRACQEGIDVLKGYKLRYGDMCEEYKSFEFGTISIENLPHSDTHAIGSDVMINKTRVKEAESKPNENRNESRPNGKRNESKPNDKRNESIEKEMMVVATTLVSMESQLPALSKSYDMRCMICQEQNVQVVFEPCYHCVLCSTCSLQSCKSFCPLCRTPITKRVKPTMGRLLQPRIYSAYSFM